MISNKAGILTFLNSLNYGAVLQAYALQRVVDDIGVNCEVLDVLDLNSPFTKKPEKYRAITSAKKMRSIGYDLNFNMPKVLNFFRKTINTKKLILSIQFLKAI